MKSIAKIHRGGERHWVGDGFPVQTVFSYAELGAEMTPFLLLDHAGPVEFAAAAHPRGVDWHPHRGFETVTLVYEGEVEHEDTAGNRGRIGPGDVQWMTAAAGVLHREMHGGAFSRRGGRFELAQLWVNLPAKHKMSAPRYQTLLARDIPAVELPDRGGLVRVIAGTFGGARGPARTCTPLNLFDLRLRAGAELALELGSGTTTGIFIARGGVVVNGARSAAQGELVVFSREGDAVAIEASADTVLLVMNGAPIDEPIAGHGPFVMNTQPELQQAIADARAGRLGQPPATTR